MLDNYFPNGSVSKPSGITREQRQRLLAVQAALEIIKASVGSGNGSAHDFEAVESHVSKIADAIQAAINKS